MTLSKIGKEKTSSATLTLYSDDCYLCPWQLVGSMEKNRVVTLSTHHISHILLTTTTQVPTTSPTYFSIQKPGTKHPIHVLFTTPTTPFSLYHPHTPYHTTIIPQHPHSPHYTTNILFTTPPITHTPNFSPWLFRKSFVTFSSYGPLVKVVIAFRLNIWGRMTR